MQKDHDIFGDLPMSNQERFLQKKLAAARVDLATGVEPFVAGAFERIARLEQRIIRVRREFSDEGKIIE